MPRCTKSNLTDLAPIVVVPPNPAATADLTPTMPGLEVQAGYLGSCASGRLEDLRAAAAVLRGRRVAPGFQLHVVPTSQAIMADAAREGLLTTLIEAGAFVTSSSCDYCYGRIATMTAGQRAVSTGTLNVTGRMGSPDSEIYLCNAAAVAASALEGRIADPRPYLCRGGGGRRVSLAPLRGRVAYVFEEADFDVDQIVGVENIRLTDPDALAACAMRRFDPGFAEKVRARRRGRRRREFRLRPSPLRADDRAAPPRHPCRHRGLLRHRLLAGGDRRGLPPDRLPRHHRPGRALGRDRDRLGGRACAQSEPGRRAPHRPLLHRRARHAAGWRPYPLPAREARRRPAAEAVFFLHAPERYFSGICGLLAGLVSCLASRVITPAPDQRLKRRLQRIRPVSFA